MRLDLASCCEIEARGLKKACRQGERSRPKKMNYSIGVEVVAEQNSLSFLPDAV